MKILDQIRGHEDLASLSRGQLPELCRELRECIIENTSKTGGHLASSLGAVEITVALHRVFDPFRDRILFDVGHQSYAHKILTGRKDRLNTLRSLGGLSGFCKPEESPADAFISGHASDSISAALGMARARTLKGEDHDVIAVIGDGAMTGGLSFEGLSDAGSSGEPIIVVLNDNGMSIGRSVGGFTSMLQHARIRPGYIRFKKAYRKLVSNVPWVYRLSHRIKEALKYTLLPANIFDDMGFNYMGPIDGHDVAALEATLRWAKELRGPVLIHAVTVKGRGYAPAEKDPELYHGVGPFDPAAGVQMQDKADFSAVFGKTAVELAERDPSVCAVTAAMEMGTGLEAFSSRFPDRYFDLGIAEEHAVAMCAGMAKQGMIPVFAVYSTFLQRAYDMLIEDVGLGALHVVLAVDRAGIVGKDGPTHQGSFDVSYLGSVPHMKIYAPSSYEELRSMLWTAVFEESGPVAVRYPRGAEGEYREDRSAEPVSVLKSGNDLTIVTFGIRINDALSAADTLAGRGISAEVVKVNRILPLETERILSSLAKTGRLLMVEDICRSGSVGSMILEAAAENGTRLACVRRIDLGDGVVCQGDSDEVSRLMKLDADGITAEAMEMFR